MIFEEENQRADARLRALESQNESKVQRRTAELLAKKEDTIKRRLSAANLRKQEIIANQDQTNTEALLQRREEIVEDLLVRVKEKAANYSRTPRYETMLCERINELLRETEEQQFILQVRTEDLERVKGCVKGSNKDITFEILPADRIAGFVMQDSRRTYAIDNTVANRIERNRYSIVRALYQELEELDGEFHE